MNMLLGGVEILQEGLADVVVVVFTQIGGSQVECADQGSDRIIIGVEMGLWSLGVLVDGLQDDGFDRNVQLNGLFRKLRLEDGRKFDRDLHGDCLGEIDNFELNRCCFCGWIGVAKSGGGSSLVVAPWVETRGSFRPARRF